MTYHPPAITPLLREQHGLITREQAQFHGLNNRRIRRRVTTSDWIRVEPDVFQLAAVSPSWESRVLAACLQSGGVAGARCAAALWRIDGFSTPPSEILVPFGSGYRNASHRIHRTKQWDRIDRQTIRSISCTGAARTILDLGAVISYQRLELATESALRQKLVSWPELLSCLNDHSRKGRDGCGKLRTLLDARYGDDHIPLSEWSTLVARLVTSRGLPKPVLEHPLVDRRGHTYAVLDLAWPKHKVALELDSLRYHFNRKSFEHDRRKRNRARNEGWIIHEVTWQMYIDAQSEVVALARDALNLRLSVVA